MCCVIHINSCVAALPSCSEAAVWLQDDHAAVALPLHLFDWHSYNFVRPANTYALNCAVA